MRKAEEGREEKKGAKRGEGRKGRKREARKGDNLGEER